MCVLTSLLVVPLIGFTRDTATEGGIQVVSRVVCVGYAGLVADAYGEP